jgi:hypothetical protein
MCLVRLLLEARPFPGVDPEADIEADPEADPEADTDADVDNAARIPGVDPEADTDAAVDNAAIIAGVDDIARNMDDRYGQRLGHYNLRPRKAPDYSYLFVNAAETSIITAQVSLYQGLRLFGDAGVEAVRKELKQLHECEVIVPHRASSLTTEEKKKVLSYLMFLKRKRDGTIKARGCADGRKLRAYTLRVDAMAPTVTTAAVFITSVIDAMEKREVAVVDIPGAFMKAEMDELVYMKLTGKMAELMCKFDPTTYSPFMSRERGQTVLYVRLVKALYGTVRAARLFWDKLTTTLEGWGFVINPYDVYVANKTINGKQRTVAWHVDDLKISHAGRQGVDDFIKQLDDEFGKESPLTKSRGDIHDYLGMNLDFSASGVVRIDMSGLIQTILSEVPKDMNGTIATPATADLFKVNTDNPVYLNAVRADVFYRITMKLMYLGLRGRPDVLSAVSFLSTRVQQPDDDDYKKLARVIRYLRGTTDLVLRGFKTDGAVGCRCIVLAPCWMLYGVFWARTLRTRVVKCSDDTNFVVRWVDV